MPAEYCLRARELAHPENASDEEKRLVREGEAEDWGRLEDRMRRIVLEAIDRLGWPEGDPRRAKYEASATHQEILGGALSPRVKDASEHVYGFFRRITNPDELERDLDKVRTAPDFVDYCTSQDGSKHIDVQLRQRLELLKRRGLAQALPGNIHDYSATWTGSGIASDHIGSLPEKLEDCLKLN